MIHCLCHTVIKAHVQKLSLGLRGARLHVKHCVCNDGLKVGNLGGMVKGTSQICWTPDEGPHSV